MTDYQTQWADEVDIILNLLRETPLQETTKWGIPVFTLNKKNVIGLAGFKNHLSVWFYDGIFINDTYNSLINASEGKTKALRQLRFTKAEGINVEMLSYYVKEAIQNAEKGVSHVPNSESPFSNPPEYLRFALEKNPQLNECFNNLPPYKRKEYNEYIDTAKQEKTKQTRLAKITPLILAGKGLNDKYK